VKVAHHGSRTSSTEDFVAADARIHWHNFGGGTSMFGSPHKDVVERGRKKWGGGDDHRGAGNYFDSDRTGVI